MTYITLSECIRGLDSTAPIALQRDKVTGWHVTIFKGASVEEICAEVNLLDSNETKVITKLFKSAIDIIERERDSYLAALRNLNTASQNIQSYKITNQSLLFDIALKATDRSEWGVSQYIQNYGIEQEEKRYQIAALAAAQDGTSLSKYIQNYAIKDQEMLFQIALKAAEQSGMGVSVYISNYGIKDEKLLYLIALKAAAQSGEGVSSCISSYGIVEEEKRYQIALKAAAQNGASVSWRIQNYVIKDQEMLFQIALTAAAQNGAGISEFIQKYGIKDEEKRFQIALKAGAITECIQNYGIQNQERLYRIALQAVALNEKGVCEHFPNYGIEEEEKRYQIALKVAEKNGLAVSLQITNFDIKDEDLLYRIALKAAGQDGVAVSYLIPRYNIKNKEKLYRIALRAILQNARITDLDNYGLKDNALDLFAESLLDPSKGHHDAFRSLILKARGSEFPQFLMVENPDPFVQQKMRRWLVELIFTELTNEQIEKKRPLFTQLMQLRNPTLRSQITPYLPEAYKNMQGQSVPLKVPKKDYTELARLLHLGQEPNTLTCFYSKLEDPLDQEVYLTFLLKIKGLKSELLMQPNRKAMLHFMRTAIDIMAFGHPELLTGDLDKQLEHLFLSQLQGLKVDNFKQAYEKTLNKFRSKELIFTYLSSLEPEAKPYFKDIVEFILNGTFFDKRYDVPHLKMIFEKFPIEKEWRKGETTSDLLSAPVEQEAQIPISILEMKVKIITDKHLNISEKSPLYRCLMGADLAECLKELQSEIRAEVSDDLKIQIKCLQLLDPALTIGNKTKYLFDLDQLCKGMPFQNDVQGWQNLMSQAVTRSDYTVSDTDDPNHLFLLGEEVSGSCQKITEGDPTLNKGLLGYMLNGYNRAVIVTDSSGMIVARCLIRLYWDGEMPVLYRERFYTRSTDPQLKPLVEAMCKRRAKALNVPLVSANEPYPKDLHITGGRVDIEYVDAIGGIRTSKHIVRGYEV